MKKIAFIIICFLLISCSNEYQVKKEVEKYVEKNFNDPNSYELIELKLFDTITEQKVSLFLKTQRLNKIEKIKKFIDEKKQENARIASNAFFSGNHLYMINTMKKLDGEKKIIESYEKDSIKIIVNEIKILGKYTTSKKPSHFRYVHEYRAKNDVGALVRCTDTLRVNNDQKLIEDFQDFLVPKYGVGLN